MTEVPEEKLFNQFPGIPKSEWEKKISDDLKGVDYDNCLVYKTLDGLNLQPYYRAEDTRELKYLDGFPGEFPYVRTGKKDSNSWEIRQDLVAGEPAETSRLAAEIINRGVPPRSERSWSVRGPAHRIPPGCPSCGSRA